MTYQDGWSKNISFPDPLLLFLVAKKEEGKRPNQRFSFSSPFWFGPELIVWVHSFFPPSFYISGFATKGRPPPPPLVKSILFEGGRRSRESLPHLARQIPFFALQKATFMSAPPSYVRVLYPSSFFLPPFAPSPILASPLSSPNPFFPFPPLSHSHGFLVFPGKDSPTSTASPKKLIIVHKQIHMSICGGISLPPEEEEGERKREL